MQMPIHRTNLKVLIAMLLPLLLMLIHPLVAGLFYLILGLIFFVLATPPFLKLRLSKANLSLKISPDNNYIEYTALDYTSNIATSSIKRIAIDKNNNDDISICAIYTESNKFIFPIKTSSQREAISKLLAHKNDRLPVEKYRQDLKILSLIIPLFLFIALQGDVIQLPLSKNIAHILSFCCLALLAILNYTTNIYVTILKRKYKSFFFAAMIAVILLAAVAIIDKVI